MHDQIIVRLWICREMGQYPHSIDLAWSEPSRCNWPCWQRIIIQHRAFEFTEPYKCLEALSFWNAFFRDGAWS